MQIIKSIHGEDILVEDCDFDFLNQFRWTKSPKGYFRCSQSGFWQGDQIDTKQLHWFVMKLSGLEYPPRMSIDHINRNPADNTHKNLRFATQSQQVWNQSLRSDNTSGVRGVCLLGTRWVAYINFKGIRKHIGVFDFKEQAHLAYLIERTKTEQHELPWSELCLVRETDLEVTRRIKTSKYTGVYKFRKRWQAQVCVNGHKIHLGTHDTELEAHEAYLRAKEGLNVR